MNTAKRIHKRHLTERLEALCVDFRFTWGQPTSRSDGRVDVSIDRAGSDPDRGHLLTVFAGLPPPPEVEGLTFALSRADSGKTVAEYRTDRRGQIRLRGLEPGEYCLAFAGTSLLAQGDDRMGKYGQVAVQAAALVRAGAKSVTEAWDAAAQEVFPNQDASREKNCPRGAFLGLCEAGLVVGIPVGHYTESTKNKAYAVAAVHLLVQNPALAESKSATLWQQVMGDQEKEHNAQMDIVLALWKRDLIARGRVPGGAAGDRG